MRFTLSPGAIEHYGDAEYYDFTYRTRKDDVAYYRRFARRVGGPILEIGGGSGRVAVPLVRDGHHVDVLDASGSMLRQARRRAMDELDASERSRLTLRRGDMRDFSFRKRFALIIAPFNVLLHLYEPDDFAACFGAVARHLAPEGRFVFDVRIPNLRELGRDPHRRYTSHAFRHPTLGYRVKYCEVFDYDSIKQVQHVRIRFEPDSDAPRGARVRETLLSQRQIFPNELRALLALGGLQLASRHGDFSGRPLAPDDATQVVVARIAK